MEKCSIFLQMKVRVAFEGETERLDIEAEEIEHTLIERDYSKKPFLGGYRHKHTGVEYVHASTQTPSNNKALVVQVKKQSLC